MLGLTFSIAALALGPMLARATVRYPAWHAGVGGLTLVVVISLVALTLLPEAITHAGPVSLIFAAAGLGLPSLAEKLLHHAEDTTHRVALAVASGALIVHAASDGAILAIAAGGQDYVVMVAAIVLHRLGASLAIWGVIRPTFSASVGLAVLLAMAVMTVVGFFTVQSSLSLADSSLMGYWQAFAAGSLLHVVLHPVGALARDVPTLRGADRIGTLLGLGFAVMIVALHMMQPDTGFTGDHGDAAAHGHHGLDMLMLAGAWLSPLVIAIHAIGMWRRRRQGLRLNHALLDTAPWMLLLWLGSSLLVLGLLDDHAHLPPTVFIGAHIGWLALVLLTMGGVGVRRFLHPLMPTGHHHHH